MALDERALPLRERKRLRTRRALADAALRLFSEKGYDATTLDELVDEAEVSRSTFFRAFATKEAVAIEAETELWSKYIAALGGRQLSGSVLAELRETLAETLAALDADWDRRYLVTRRLVLTAPALLAQVEYHRSGVQKDIVAVLADKLALEADDLRLHILAELAITAWSVAGRAWVHADGKGGRKNLAGRLRAAFAAIEPSLSLAAD